MEVFVDGGLFEVAALAGGTALGRWLYSQKILGRALVILSVLGPLAILFLAETGTVRWLAGISSVTAFLNATVVFPTIGRDRPDVSHPTA